jgi:phosphoribosylformylglycinamidine cyclo-ligase
MSIKKISYDDAGVNIDAGNKLVDSIKPYIKNTNRSGVMGNIGGFGGLFDLKACNYKDPILVSATDGVGTKLKIAIEANNCDFIGQDLVAMCVNDLVVQGAEPLFFLDYYACAKLEQDKANKIIKSIAKACKLAGCALIGGESAEMPGLYSKNDFDLAGFTVGAVERENILPHSKDINTGDVIIAIPSSGVHSNGFSLVRKIMSEYNLSYADQAEFNKNKTYNEVFLTPTEIYVKPCLQLHKNNLVKAFCHITGGGIVENIPRILPNNLTYDIALENLQLPDLFTWLQNKSSLELTELYTVFNCGIGMVAVIKPDNLEPTKAILADFGYSDIKQIGTIIEK